MSLFWKTAQDLQAVDDEIYAHLMNSIPPSAPSKRRKHRSACTATTDHGSGPLTDPMEDGPVSVIEGLIAEGLDRQEPVILQSEEGTIIFIPSGSGVASSKQADSADHSLTCPN